MFYSNRGSNYSVLPLKSCSYFSFFINSILTKGSFSGTNPKAADTSNSCGAGTGPVEAIDENEGKMEVWERMSVTEAHHLPRGYMRLL